LDWYLDEFVRYLGNRERHSRQVAKWSAAEKANPSAESGKKAPKPEPPKLAPLLIESTTGIGKTFNAAPVIARAVQQLDIPVLIVVRDHQLAAEFEGKLKQAGVNAHRYYGRTPPLQNWTPSEGRPHPGPEWVCQKFETIPKIAAENHRPAVSLCRNCEHGMSRELFKAVARGDAEKEETCKKWFDKFSLNSSDVAPCRWLDALYNTLQQQVVIIPAQSFSDKMTAQITDSKTNETRPRLVIIDESGPAGTQIRVEAKDIIGWLNNIDAGVKHVAEIMAQESAKQARPSPLAEELGLVLKGLGLAKSTLEICSAELGAAGNKKAQLSDKGLEALRSLHLNYGKVLMASGTARWEQVVRLKVTQDQDEFSIPLRATSAILASARAGVVKIDRGAIVAHEIAPALEFLSAGKFGGVLMDATPSRATRTVIDRAGGIIKKIIAPQNLKIVRHPQYYWGRGDVRKRTQHEEVARRSVGDALTLIRENFHEKHVCEVGVITHKAWLNEDTLNKFPEAENWGWWGADHIGTDRFKHMDLAIFGSPLPSVDALRVLYSIDRAVVAQLGVDWPEWDDEAQHMELQEAAGKELVECKFPLPRDETCRAWVLDYVLCNVTQAIGRVRGASWFGDRPLEVHVFGGVPLVGLEGHGLRVDEYRWERVRPTRKEWGASSMAKIHNTHRQEKLAKNIPQLLNEALEMLSTVGARIGERSMLMTLHNMQASVPRADVRAFLKSTGLQRSKGGPTPAGQEPPSSMSLVAPGVRKILPFKTSRS
jgi:hypothetical protein